MATVRVVVRTPFGLPFCIDWLPDDCLLIVSGRENLVLRREPDGSLGDPREGFHFYRAPWAFGVVGETEAAAAVCGWIRRTMRTPQTRKNSASRAN